MKIMVALLMLALPSVSWAECIATPRSGWISELCYDSSRVTATMSGSKYTFCGISRSLFDEWVSAPSLGKFYHARINGRFSC